MCALQQERYLSQINQGVSWALFLHAPRREAELRAVRRWAIRDKDRDAVELLAQLDLGCDQRTQIMRQKRSLVGG
jgi:hypothetical protein